MTVELLTAENVRFDEKGLIPVIVQDAVSKAVLTLAYMNEESLQRSLETKETWFWSRSRQELWHKGATSGNTQRIVSIQVDCDGDALVVQVVPNGPACHTGAYSCFAGELLAGGQERETAEGSEKAVTAVTSATVDRFAILGELEALIAAREAERPEGSYTTYLFEKGVDKILKKVGEEAAEVIIAAKNRSHEELRYEASDLIFHLLVLLREQKLPLDDVLTELQRRR
ncbi:histidine biosynthesis bifunctional protein HisIE [Brevibacillus agri]|uniref:Histidine biosynthesis bifunctional protein HisIE n=1 Tax=Brevibacillus agri TaxID=51101 RepID=A0A3M8B7C0_9BACL|nr:MULTISPECIES: bifunctional phosphoribosyl-AMP cyclohydrolase/phosphoribosyl-ATP diphosphatase HisIE [Brevibacillus]ELK42445.1 bifunctional phosphoribosyl-AMP cyclohydrolase/phosphoribosyl-ATP pyrophosphatase protein [Brevibacillus agri BAB-2500]MDT7985529.1 bifunctional phosphoribosyl-AMP cyclohydrolase/phosphoribosyl-ATP diphosphatase HisIE [Clostridium perfringens]EJL46827.1 phosphoribosyl-ATP pyrophosphohydrolase [Brevibacillus sp. CF112]MBG9567961.1 phosphoribosyl-ATP pyrophosphatase [Br